MLSSSNSSVVQETVKAAKALHAVHSAKGKDNAVEGISGGAGGHAFVLSRSYSHFRSSVKSDAYLDTSHKGRDSIVKGKAYQCLGEPMLDLATNKSWKNKEQKTVSEFANKAHKSAPNKIGGSWANGTNNDRLLSVNETDRSRKLQLELFSLRSKQRKTGQTLRTMIAQSERNLQGTKAGKSFIRMCNDLDDNLSSRKATNQGPYRAMGMDFDKLISDGHRARGSGYAGMGHQGGASGAGGGSISGGGVHHSSSSGRGGRRRPPRVPPPLVLNKEPDVDIDKDEFYQYLVMRSPRAANIYRGSSGQGHSRYNAHAKRRDNQTNKNGEQTRLEEEESSGESDDERNGTRRNTTESLRENCIKFDKLKLKLGGILDQQLEARTTERSISCRAKFDVADKLFDFQSSFRDLSQMRRLARKSQRTKLALRKRHFKLLRDTIDLHRREGNDQIRDLTKNERHLLQQIFSHVQSPSGWKFGLPEWVNVLGQCDVNVIKDARVLRLVDEINNRVLRVSENDFRAHLYGSGMDLPIQLYDIQQFLENTSTTVFMGGARAAALASKLLRKRGLRSNAASMTSVTGETAAIRTSASASVSNTIDEGGSSVGTAAAIEHDSLMGSREDSIIAGEQ